MSFFYLKALHIIFVVTWFAGLFYIVRLFIYHREAMDKSEPEKKILIDQFSIMEKRLWYGITWPSAVLTLLFGPSLLPSFMPINKEYWLHAKLFLVFLLFLYHLQCGRIFKSLQNGETHWTSMKLRIWNEVATLFLVAIVFLVILKDMASMGYGILGLVIFSGVLMLGIRFYRKLRSS
ncbi:MAG: CopD family protein [Deltaproteobacteria bacterium]|jgi:protoporphyrinogen IX oxidase|nr:MAG: CopD family protein [Deltaproteobacteria bacterium]TNF31080.1 MAG: CopD family protein [Deltaproteobacteria bacterium]